MGNFFHPKAKKMIMKFNYYSVFLASLASFILLLAPMGATLADSLAPQAPVIVFAAASTTNAVTEIIDVYTKQNNRKIICSFAASSTLAKQIDNGAPAHIYVSANGKWMDYLEQRQMIIPDSRIDLLGNRIVLIAPKTARFEPIELRPGFPLAERLGDGRLAMGDPGHVPAGIYGKQAFIGLGIWVQIKDRLAPMKDVRAALALVERGEVPLGQVYATDAAISTKVRVVGTFPQSSHPPIIYPVAIVVGGRNPAVERFMTFIQSPRSRIIFEHYGFVVNDS